MATRVFGNFRALMAAAKSSSTSSAAVGSKEPKGILKVVPVSPQLSEFVGASEVSRSEAVKKVWQYIKLHNLQNPANKREIRCDAKLKTIFNGKDTVGFLEIAKLMNQHFVKSA
ncbi:upstream activation factor subunit spp27 [Melia azedarach]|uniref:Upstream activation factor subunit spp27 n=1 Tax=Melia azedarach TaxID=155640 RepID=A0ACC1XA45_MELAZ|nr:upstream activation factor subunit spp27 [Melia azedarach]